jgi:Ricin-type beta-trefoil lectin domain-like
MKKILVLAIMMMVILSACGTSAPSAAPAPTTAPTVAPAPTTAPVVAQPTSAPTVAPTSTPKPPVDTTLYYRLTNQSLGDSLAIDIINEAGTKSNALQMAKVGDYSGQYWEFIPWGDGTYKITCSFLANAGSVVDMTDAGKAVMADADQSANTQHWKITPLADGSYHLSNLAKGDGWSLAISSDGRNKFVMVQTATDNHQNWIFKSLGSNQ